MSAPAAPHVRPALSGEVVTVAELLYLSAAGMYDRYAGGREAALRLLRASFSSAGTNASAEVVCVAELDGRIAGVLSGFPVGEGTRRSRAFLRVTLRSLPPWRWPAAISLYRLGGRLTPPAPPGSFYVDGLATHPEARRRGAARALLDAAERRARALGLTSLSLDTALDNTAARSLYEGFGFRPTHEIAPVRGLPGFVGYVKRLG